MTSNLELSDAQIPASGRRAMLRADGRTIALFSLDDTQYAMAT